MQTLRQEVYLLRESDHLKESGQGLVEYALILIFVAVAVVVVLALLGPAIGNMFSNILTLL